MRHDYFHNRRSKKSPIDGSVPGISYSRFRRFSPPSEFHYHHGPKYHHDLYMNDNPQEYRPDLNAPMVDWDEYQVYDPPIIASRPSPENARQYLSQNNSLDSMLETQQDFNPDIHFQQPDEEDVTRKFFDLTDALKHLQETLPKDHPDILNVRNAISEIINDPASVEKIEKKAGDIGPSNLGPSNPYEVDIFEQATAEFNQNMNMLEQTIHQYSETPPEYPMSHDMHALTDFDNQAEVSVQPMPQFQEPDLIDNLQPPINMQMEDEINQAIDNAIQSPSEPMLQDVEPEWQHNPLGQLQDQNYMMPQDFNPMPPGFEPMGPM